MRVAVVGAGASGLPAIKTCLEYGFDVVCFEKSDAVGGLWRFKPEECEGEASVMKSTVINTSKEITAYSDFPPPSDAANYMHNRQLLDYLKAYADHHSLTTHIRFRTQVISVKRADDFNKTAKWIVVSKETGNDASEISEVFDGVMLASGHHADRHMPLDAFPGVSSFKGQVLHSHSYKDHRGYEDKRVAVIGIGNSAVDMVVELSHVAEQVYLVTRRGAWLLQRISWYGLPIDVTYSRFKEALRVAFPNFVAGLFEREMNQRCCHDTYALRPAHGIFQAHPTVNDALPNRIASGTVIVKPNIKKFTEKGLVFEDDTTADVDVVVFSTGYSFGFPYLENGKLIEVDENQVSLYQYMYKTDMEHPETMCVLGLIQPLGSIMPISEMQSRVFCDILSGRSKLPSRKEMELDLEAKRDAMAQRYVASRRHTIQVDFLPYMDGLADLIGVRPRWWDTLTSGDPTLAYHLVFGPPVSYQYRLTGPHTWPGARDAILGVMRRVRAATATRPVPPRAVQDQMTPLIVKLIAVLAFFFLLWWRWA